jgi:Rps23 Pro-64 3,4-dihydroxylase Tpa1-like proline 4-hydroxylase
MASSISAFELCQSFLARFEAFCEANREAFQRAEPFPYAVADGLLDERLIERILREYPARNDPIWQHYDDSDIQIKVRSNWKSDADITPDIREVVRAFTSGRFLLALSRLTGISHLISDPYLTGGGVSSVYRGGMLDLHCDGNWHDAMAVHRRLNAILHLNPGWQESWGGDLEFWDRKMERCVTKVAPLNNRFIVFRTNDYSFHGHPQPLACPEHESRRSLILYYYTSRPRDEDEVAKGDPHRALWRSRGQIRGATG